MSNGLILVIQAILLTFVATSQVDESIECNNVKTGNLRSTDGKAIFSFTITPDIDQIWFTTCGSEPGLHTHLYVYYNDSMIASNIGIGSPCEGNKAFIHLDNVTVGHYELYLNATEYGTEQPVYSLQMFCNNFVGWPGMRSCNHIGGFPINFCLLSTFPDTSLKPICNQNQQAMIILYLDSTDCSSENTNMFNSSYIGTDWTCNATTDCEYASVSARYNLNYTNEVCVDNSSISFEARDAMVIDVCMFGNVKHTCSDNVLYTTLYPDALCSETPISSKIMKEGCFTESSDGYNQTVYVESIRCTRSEGGAGAQDDYSLQIGLSVGGFVLLVICVGVWWCARKRKLTDEQRRLNTGGNDANSNHNPKNVQLYNSTE